MTKSIAYLDSKRMLQGLSAGFQRLFQRREYIDRINVFPVPDGDTGTNLVFSFKVIQKAVQNAHGLSLKELMAKVARASVDGARGNSGAIMAQYFYGFSESLSSDTKLTAVELATASSAGAKASWSAMSEPVAGTLPTVLEDFSKGLERKARDGVEDIRELLDYGLKCARESLARTPELLPILKQKGVVDAGGQGFVDLMEGICTFIETGETDEAAKVPEDALPDSSLTMEMDTGAHRFCTECVIQGEALDRVAIMQELQKLDCSSLIVAGGNDRVRVHLHVNDPGEAYLACEQFGELHQQKADDMERQHTLMNQAGHVAIVADSGADIPFEEQERLGIHMVPVRLNFGTTEYIDHVSLKPADLYRMLEESNEVPKTSQPPAGDFSRQYDLLTAHSYEVMSVGLSEALSGTTQAARTAAEKFAGQVRVFDTQSASCGQGILAVIAAEAAQMGMTLDQVEALLEEYMPQARTIAIANDLTYLTRGGRLPGWVKKFTDFVHISPLLTAKQGRFGLAGVTTGVGAKPSALGKAALRRMQKDTTYRILIAHGANQQGALELRRYILQRHTRVHSCHITEVGPALGVHLGPGGLVIGFLPQPAQLN